MKLKTPFEVWLSSPIRSEKGLHQSLYCASRFLLDEGWNNQEIFILLRRLEYDRRVPDREIFGAIEDAHRAKVEGITGITWPKADLAFQVEVIRLYGLEMSRIEKQADKWQNLSVFECLHILFHPDDLLCIGFTATDFQTVRLAEINESLLEQIEFINPSPMSAHIGLTEGKNWSYHSRANTGRRVYAVIEFDSGEIREHVAILRWLSKRLPLVMAVHSGSVSLHGWFKCSHVSEQEVTEFYKEAVSLGADSKMYSPSQFSRMPMGRNRATGRRQQIYYINPQQSYTTSARKLQTQSQKSL